MIRVTSINLVKLNLPFSTNIGNPIDARLQTAISSGFETSIISVQRFEDFIIPIFFFFFFLLHASLYNIYGVPVSICASNIENHNSCADIVFLPILFFS